MLPDPSSYQSLGWLGVGICAVVFAANQLKSLYDSFRDKPPPRDLFATKEEHRLLSARVDRFEAILRAEFDKLDREREASASKLYSRIETDMTAIRHEMRQDNKAAQARFDVLLENVSKLKGQIEALPR